MGVQGLAFIRERQDQHLLESLVSESSLRLFSVYYRNYLILRIDHQDFE